MNEGRTVFAQLLDFLPKYEFDKCVARYRGNRRVRKLPAYEQFLVLAFAQLIPSLNNKRYNKVVRGLVVVQALAWQENEPS
jgi:hypothetical protein